MSFTIRVASVNTQAFPFVCSDTSAREGHLDITTTCCILFLYCRHQAKP